MADKDDLICWLFIPHYGAAISVQVTLKEQFSLQIITVQ